MVASNHDHWGPSAVFEIDPQRLNRHQTSISSLNTWILVINHCLWRLYKVPSLDNGGFLPWPLGPSVVFEINPQMLELTSYKQNQAKYMNFCHKPLPMIAVQSPQLRRWWLLTMTTGAQCGVWNQHTMLLLMSDKQNYPPYMDFCHKPLPIVAVQGPQLRRWCLRVMATGAQCGV